MENETNDQAIQTRVDDEVYRELESVDIIASGYEFNCPNCDTNNTLIAIPKYGTAIECHSCHEKFAVSEALDAHD